MSSNKKCIVDNPDTFSVFSNRFSHDLFPQFLNLHGLYIAFDPALVQELFYRISHFVLAHGAKIKKYGKVG